MATTRGSIPLLIFTADPQTKICRLASLQRTDRDESLGKSPTGLSHSVAPSAHRDPDSMKISLVNHESVVNMSAML